VYIEDITCRRDADGNYTIQQIVTTMWEISKMQIEDFLDVEKCSHYFKSSVSEQLLTKMTQMKRQFTRPSRKEQNQMRKQREAFAEDVYAKGYELYDGARDNKGLQGTGNQPLSIKGAENLAKAYYGEHCQINSPPIHILQVKLYLALQLT